MPRRFALILLALAAAVPALALARETVGTDSGITSNGRQLDPVGRLTALGAFPTGGALTPDGRFYWAVDAGRGVNAVRIIDMHTGEIVQTLPIPGGYVGVAFAPGGRRAFVSGQAAEGDQPPNAVGTDGDVIHVYKVKRGDGTAVEANPIGLPSGTADGAAADDELPPASGVNAWPEGLAVTPDGKYLVVALGQADQAAIIDLKTKDGKLAGVGRYPYGVAIDPSRPRAYVTNERDGTVSVISIPDGNRIATIGVGGSRGDAYAHPEGLTVDPTRDRLYVAVTDRDLVAVINTETLQVVRKLNVGRKEAAIGSAPVNVGVDPHGQTLYVANAGEDAILAIALRRRPKLSELETRGRYLLARSIHSIGRYRDAIAREQNHHRRRARKLRRRYLYGSPHQACGGPSLQQDRHYGTFVLDAYDRRSRARHAARELTSPQQRNEALERANHRFARVTSAARRRLPRIKRCLPKGAIPGTPAYKTLGRFPTAAYPTDVEITPNGRKLVWLSSKGLGTGPNADDESIKELLLGRAGVLRRPTDKKMKALTARADAAVVPTNAQQAPTGTPIVGPDGGASEQIKHVFYIVKENRTYDQIFGSDPRGQGDPALEVFGDNGVAGPTGGMTPNAHELSRQFALYDNTFANSEESTVGHKITAGGYANDYTERYVFTNRGRKGNPDIFPIGIPPNAFILDQAVRQNVSFRVYGELGAGNQPFADDGRPTFDQVLANTDPSYPSQIQGTCQPAVPFPPGTPLSVRCTADSGILGTTAGPPNVQSRERTFAGEFSSQLADGTVPALNYMILFNDHTNGTTPGVYSPRANIADNDLALGQVVQLVSQSSIWDESAIFVVEDDSQDGADSVDAHRIPVQVISPWAKHDGQAISTRFDQYSFLRTAELILGLRPLSINDALATPLYDAFISGSEQPDVEGTRYTAIQPEVSMTETNPASAPNAALSAALPWNQVDAVPQRISDRIIWHSIFGAEATPPPPGPNYSPVERARAVGAMQRYRAGRSVRRFLIGRGEHDDG